MINKKLITTFALGALILTACGGGGSNPVTDAKQKLEKELVGTWYPTDDNKTATKCENDENDGTSSKELTVFKNGNNLVITEQNYSELDCKEDDTTFNIDMNFNYSVGEVVKDDLRVLNLDMTGYTLHKGEINCQSDSEYIACRYMKGDTTSYAPFKLDKNLLYIGQPVKNKADIKAEFKGAYIKI